MSDKLTALPRPRPYGILSDDGDCLYGYESLSNLMDSVDERDDGLEPDEAIVRIDKYTILAIGS